jgi:hypothetical protein
MPGTRSLDLTVPRDFFKRTNPLTMHPIQAASRAAGTNSTGLRGLINTGVQQRGIPLTRSGSVSLGKMSDAFTNSGRIRHPTLFGGQLKINW